GSAHLVEAGADIFLMPSKYEPCGLNQMYSLRYGTIPVVRRTGGLADTVQEYDPTTNEGTAFFFTDHSFQQFSPPLHPPLPLWPDKEKWRALMLNGIRQNLNWEKSATKYLDAYRRVGKM